MAVTRDRVRALISDAYYEARNEGRTMEQAADDAADRVMNVVLGDTPAPPTSFGPLRALLEEQQKTYDELPPIPEFGHDSTDDMVEFERLEARNELAWEALRLMPQLPDPQAQPPGPAAFHDKGPETERQAFERFAVPRAGTLREKVLTVLLNHPDGMTDREIAKALERYLYSVAPRRTELLHMGWVEDSGQRRSTSRDPGGPQAVVWRLTDEGLAIWSSRSKIKAV